MTRKMVVIGVSLVAVIAATLLTLKELKSASAAYIYGYPLVLMDKTRQAMFTGGGEINQFNHVQKFPDHTFRNVVRPNNDTLYSIAWLDLSEDAQVLTVPAMPDRYYVMPLMDAWTNLPGAVRVRTPAMVCPAVLSRMGRDGPSQVMRTAWWPPRVPKIIASPG